MGSIRIAIGSGKAGEWSVDASAVEPRDMDLIERATSAGLFRSGFERGICSTDGELHGDAWLVVVGGGDELDERLDRDGAVVAYCEAP